jgi:hypothetical protein
MFRTLAAALCAAILATASLAEGRTETISFAPGTSSDHITDALRGDHVVHYRVEAAQGQRMVVHLTADRGTTYFNVTHAHSDTAIFNGSAEGNTFRQRLPQGGVWVITVYQMGAPAANNRVTNFELDVAITTPRNDHPIRSEPPAPHRVPGSVVHLGHQPQGTTFDIRRWPDAGSDVVHRVGHDRNFYLDECRTDDGTEWCEITALNNPDFYGWVQGRFVVAN